MSQLPVGIASRIFETCSQSTLGVVDVSLRLFGLGFLSREHRSESSIWFSSLIGPHSEVSPGAVQAMPIVGYQLLSLEREVLR